MMRGLPVLREQTRVFIAERPTSVAVSRATLSDDGAGGTTRTDPQTLPVQTVRLVPRATSVSSERRTVNGEVVRPDYNMVAEYDADLKRGDTFVAHDITYEVIWINDLEYELLVEVVAR